MELLVVIAVIGVLATIIMASLNSARDKGIDAKTITEVHSLKTALELYYLDHGSYPVIPIADASAKNMTAFCSDDSADPVSTAAVADLMTELNPYLPSAFKIDKCLWYTGHDSNSYIGPSYCDIDHYVDGQGYIILYNLPTKKIEPDYYTTYSGYTGDSALYNGNFHCTTHAT